MKKREGSGVFVLRRRSQRRVPKGYLGDRWRVPLYLILAIQWTLQPACAETSWHELQEKRIPTLPSAPPDWKQKTSQVLPPCERPFTYGGVTQNCDSSDQDAEHLRPILTSVPAALAELDQYQANRKKVQWAAYLGTAGLLAVILGMCVNRPAFDPSRGVPRVGGYLFLGGIGLATHSFIYGLGMMKSNQAHIGNAVQLYNQVYPEQPIVLHWSTGIEF